MSDDVTTTTPAQPGTTTIIERSGGGSGFGIVMGVILLLAVAIGAFYLINQNSSQNKRDDAIAGAAKSVEKTADKIGDAVEGKKKN
jgi:uncharacterized membrane protein